MKLRKLLLFPLAILIVSCLDISAIFPDYKEYYVVFEGHPALLSKDVYSKGFVLGKIIDKELGKNNRINIKIKIKNKYANNIKSNCILIVKDGHLELIETDSNGHPLEEKSKILGFSDKTEYYMFITKNKVKNISEITAKKANEIFNEYFK